MQMDVCKDKNKDHHVDLLSGLYFENVHSADHGINVYAPKRQLVKVRKTSWFGLKIPVFGLEMSRQT